MNKDKYIRLLECAVLATAPKRNQYKLSIGFCHEEDSLAMKAYVMCDEETLIYEYKENILAENISHDGVESFNGTVDRIKSVFNIKEKNKDYITFCPTCKQVSIWFNRKQYTCTRCILSTPAIDLIDSAFKGKQSYVYLIINTNNNALKIGTSVDPYSRLKSLQTGSSEKLSLICYFPGGVKAEKKLHRSFASIRLNGEWFQYDDKIIEAFTELIRQYLPKRYKESFSL